MQWTHFIKSKHAAQAIEPAPSLNTTRFYILSRLFSTVSCKMYMLTMNSSSSTSHDATMSSSRLRTASVRRPEEGLSSQKASIRPTDGRDPQS